MQIDFSKKTRSPETTELMKETRPTLLIPRILLESSISVKQIDGFLDQKRFVFEFFIIRASFI